MRRTLTLAIAPLFFTHTAGATDYFASPNGSDAATGLLGAPFQTLDHAVGFLHGGDTLTVEDGTYAGFLMEEQGGTPQARILIRARNRGGAKINSPASGRSDNVDLLSAHHITLDGFEIMNAPRAGVSIRTLSDETGADTAGNTIQFCNVHDNGGGVTAGRHDGIFTGFARDVVIQYNLVWNNSEHGIYVSNSADNPVIFRNVSHHNLANGIQINADLSSGGDGLISNWLIEGNTVHHNGGAAGINLDGAIFGALLNNLVYENDKGGVTLFEGDSAEAAHDNVIANNTIFSASGSRAALQVADGANNNVVFNNVLYSGSDGLEVQTVTGLVHDYNLVSSYAGSSANTHESSPAPSGLFVNLAGEDFHPQVALVDHGIGTLSGRNAPSFDLEARSRSAGSGYDIGCYEQGGIPGDGGFVWDGGTVTEDSGPSSDGGTSMDAGPFDSGFRDASLLDATTADSASAVDDAASRAGPSVDAGPAKGGGAEDGCSASVRGAPCEGWGGLLAPLLLFGAMRQRRVGPSRTS